MAALQQGRGSDDKVEGDDEVRAPELLESPPDVDRTLGAAVAEESATKKRKITKKVCILLQRITMLFLRLHHLIAYFKLNPFCK